MNKELREKVRRMLCGFTLGVSTNSEADQVINLILDEAIEAVDKNMSQSPELMQAIEILEQIKGNKL